MRKYLFFCMVILFVSVIFTSCENFTPIPAPEVTVIYFSPLGVYTCPGDTIPIGMLETRFKVWNYVDARLKNMSYVYRSVPGDDIITPVYNMGLDVLLSGGDETCVDDCITTVYNLWLEADSAIAYMTKNDISSVAEITFTGEDDFDKGKEFECKIYFSLNLVP